MVIIIISHTMCTETKLEFDMLPGLKAGDSYGFRAFPADAPRAGEVSPGTDTAYPAATLKLIVSP